MRHSLLGVLLGAALLALGCSSEPAPAPPGTGAGGGGAGGGAATIEPVTFTVRGAFGYDPDDGATRAYYPDATSPVPLNPWLELVVTQRTADGTDAFNCIVSLFTSQPAHADAGWPAPRFGLALTEAGHQSSCYGWDPARFRDPDDAAGSFTWGLAVGALRAELDEGGSASLRATMPELPPREWEEHWGPFLMGGMLHWSALAEAEPSQPDGLYDWGYAIGYEVDDDFIVQYHDAPPADDDATRARHLDGGDPRQIPRDLIEAAPTLPRGVYVITVTRPLDAALLFATP